MGFTVEAAPARMLAIKAGKNNKTPIFLDLDALAAVKGTERIKAIKEAAGRQLTDAQAKPVRTAGTVADLAAALDAIVDLRGSPRSAIAAAGTPILQPTDERRRTGSHYTPRSLTGPIVRHALEPAFTRLGPDATPEQILDLKVCDPAMGSGAFLVEACRVIGERLVRAWARWPETRPAIPADEDEELHARRLVAQRCLYGVDKNPRAVDLARLSLWLATLAKDHEFTFLDHALKAGDSLVGLTRAQMRAANWDEGKPGLPLLKGLIDERVDAALKGRAEIRAAPDDVTRAIQEVRHRAVEHRLAQARLIGDAVLAAFFSADKPKAREKKRQEVESCLSGGDAKAWERLEALAATLNQGEAHERIRPFHWEIEFPEVFVRDNPGFDAIVGNPPFLGGSYITGSHGQEYFAYLTDRFEGCVHHCDLVGYFVRQIYKLLRSEAALGVLATQKIAQGDTREGALHLLLDRGGHIIRAQRSIVWPGEAAVVVAMLHISKGCAATTSVLDGKAVARISAFLVPGDHDSAPVQLASNPSISEGSKIYGKGFLFDDSDNATNPVSIMNEIVRDRPDLQYRILPFIGGDEVNSRCDHSAHRYVIFLSDLQDENELAGFEPLASIVRQKVLPERLRLRNTSSARQLKNKWWAYQAHRPRLYEFARLLPDVLVISFVTSHLAFVFVPASSVFSHKLGIIPTDKRSIFACAQSRAHEAWTRFLSAPVGDGFSYTDCFRTFPFPEGFETDPALEAAGEAYHARRAALMIARNEGLTKTYNRFHNSGETAADIVTLRELHAAMDAAVLRAYGWDDLAARAAPEFIEQDADEGKTPKTRLDWPPALKDELLARLLALNAARAAVERAAGLTAGLEDDEEFTEDAAE